MYKRQVVEVTVDQIQVVELLQPELVILLPLVLLKDFQVVLVIICVDHIIQVVEVVVQLK